MPEAYGLNEARFVQERIVSSAANGTIMVGPTCPEGKVWTLLQAGYYPSAAETKTSQIFIQTKSTQSFPVGQPLTAALGTLSMHAVVTEGMELKLFPGDHLVAVRDSATPGTTMNLAMRFIESDLPLYTYDEPQVVRRQAKALSTVRQRLASGGVGVTGGPGSVPQPGGLRGPGRGGPLPV